MSEAIIPTKRKRRKKRTNSRQRLAASIRVAKVGITGSINIDTGALLDYNIIECKEGDLPYYISAFRKRFFKNLNDTWSFECRRLTDQLESILQVWKQQGFVVLGQARPELDSHFDIVKEYLLWQIRERGWDKPSARKNPSTSSIQDHV